ncbi:MAG TPA: hypothetical protein PKC39_01390 [Ferruginibacter sp.]|nr:hypothetical protein [Ferruginibacter sp.]HMP19587.1 hypothetical protein [Ferruginibacter sp.]
MKIYVFIPLLLLAGCRPAIDMEDVENRAHGLSYIRGTRQLVNGKVIVKSAAGKIIEVHRFKNGQPIGNWYSYSDEDKILSQGFGADAKKYEPKMGGITLNHSFVSINQTGDFAYATCYVDNTAVFEQPRHLLRLSNEILKEYAKKYRLNRVFLYDDAHEYTVDASALLNNDYKIDTIKGRDKKTVFIQ